MLSGNTGNWELAVKCYVNALNSLFVATTISGILPRSDTTPSPCYYAVWPTTGSTRFVMSWLVLLNHSTERGQTGLVQTHFRVTAVHGAMTNSLEGGRVSLATKTTPPNQKWPYLAKPASQDMWWVIRLAVLLHVRMHFKNTCLNPDTCLRGSMLALDGVAGRPKILKIAKSDISLTEHLVVPIASGV